MGATAPEKKWSNRPANGFRGIEEAVFFFLMVIKMDIQRHVEQATSAAWADEIERAIDNVKRTQWDRWMRSEFHKAEARRRWSADRQARWEEWRKKHPHEATRDQVGQTEGIATTSSKVWVQGRVPREFLDWVERHWSHDNETKAMLSECCFEVWERGK